MAGANHQQPRLQHQLAAGAVGASGEAAGAAAAAAAAAAAVMHQQQQQLGRAAVASSAGTSAADATTSATIDGVHSHRVILLPVTDFRFASFPLHLMLFDRSYRIEVSIPGKVTISSIG